LTGEETALPHLSYSVAQEIFGMFPGYCLGVAVFDNLDNEGPAPSLAEMLRDAEKQVRLEVGGNVAEHPKVVSWRNAYRAFGAKPAEHRSSIEALVRRVLKPDSLPTISPLVDIGSIVSLRHLMPGGVHPIRHADTQVALRRAVEGDRFFPAAQAAAEIVSVGEIVLADQGEVLTRRWTWRQSVNTRTLPESRRVFFNVDGLAPSSEQAVRAALSAVESLVREFCGGDRICTGILSAANPSFETQLS
jgi:DNA/RNA-binding domain of Phe-tRNA-synthetase-like protein